VRSDVRILAMLRVRPWRSIKEPRLCQILRKILCQIIRKVTLERTRQPAQGSGLIETHVAAVTDDASVEQLFDAVVERYGRINNAGINVPPVPLDQLSTAELRSIIATNLLGSFLCARAAFRVMKAQTPQGGLIINNGCVSAYAPRPNSAPYTATKHGITGLTKSLMLDGRAFNIVGGQIDIGNATTEMSARMATGAMQANGTTMVEPRIPAKLVAEAVVHLANLPLEANIPFATIMASGMLLYGRG
jgi:NAD(P)-dependent dehydrogenase (short-subunit alcohol dehydrogenase family)